MFSQSGVPERWGDHVARVSGETLRRTQEAGATCCDSGGELKTEVLYRKQRCLDIMIMTLMCRRSLDNRNNILWT